jgi:DNA-binding NarL/FixJ family response regulator
VIAGVVLGLLDTMAIVENHTARAAKPPAGREVLVTSPSLVRLARRASSTVRTMRREERQHPRERPYRLLICDDHAVLTDALERVIRDDPDLELVASSVRSADEAVEICRRSSPDVVLMDLTLGPGMTGLDATRAIVETCPLTRVIIVTGHADEHLLVDAVEAGASGFLSKTEGAAAVLDAAKAAARGESLFDTRSLVTTMLRVGQERQADRIVASALDALTPRESEVLRLLTEGLRNEEIAVRLHVSPHTAQTHVGNILAKLGVRSRGEAVAFSLRHRSRERFSPPG